MRDFIVTFYLISTHHEVWQGLIYEPERDSGCKVQGYWIKAVPKATILIRLPSGISWSVFGRHEALVLFTGSTLRTSIEKALPTCLDIVRVSKMIPLTWSKEPYEIGGALWSVVVYSLHLLWMERIQNTNGVPRNRAFDTRDPFIHCDISNIVPFKMW